jgi:hypothetical protein
VAEHELITEPARQAEQRRARALQREHRQARSTAACPVAATEPAGTSSASSQPARHRSSASCPVPKTKLRVAEDFATVRGFGLGTLAVPEK